MKRKHKIITLSTFLVFFGTFMIQAQMIQSPEIAAFRWKQRLLLVVSDDADFINKQLKLISEAGKQTAWEERRLVWIVITPDRYRIQGSPWKRNHKLYEDYRNDTPPGYCMLVGLDGSIKQKSNGMVSLQEVFDLIDTMPMRQSEIKQ